MGGAGVMVMVRKRVGRGEVTLGIRFWTSSTARAVLDDFSSLTSEGICVWGWISWEFWRIGVVVMAALLD